MQRSDCPISCVLDLLGDKWTLLILRDALYKGYTTYGEFQSSEEKIATNILAARLKKMMQHGLFEKVRDPENKLKIHYMLTEKGRSLNSVLMAMGDWGVDHIGGTCDMREEIRKAMSSGQG